MAKKMAKNENNKWDSQKISNGFFIRAQDAGRYLFDKVSEKVKNNSAYERIYDDFLAKFLVYDHLHGQTFLHKKQSLIAELNYMLANPPSSHKIYDAERFKRYYRTYVQEVLRNLETS